MERVEDIEGKRKEWYEDYTFTLYYGEGGFPNFGEESLRFKEIHQFEEDEQREMEEVIFATEKGDLILRIPLLKLEGLKQEVEEIDKYAMTVLAKKSRISLEKLGGTIESIDESGKHTLLGTNYSVVPNKIKEKVLEEREIDFGEER